MSASSSDPSRKRPDRPPTNIKPPLTRRNDPHEEGLWNLDEESNPGSHITDEATQGIAPREPDVIDSAVEQPTTIEPKVELAADEDEPITRIEPTYHRRRLSRNQRRAVETDLTEELTEEQPAEEEAAPSVEQPEPKAAAPERSIPMGLGLTEDEVWADFLSEDEPEELGATESPRMEDQIEPDGKTETPTEQIPEEEGETIHDAPILDEQEAAEMDSPLTLAEKELEAAMSPADLVDQPTIASAPQGDPSSSPQQPSARSLPKLSRFEMLASLLFLVCLIYAGVWAVQSFRREVQAQPNPYQQPELPSNGSWAKVTSIKTFWRAPVTDGPNADTVRQDITMIPVASIALGQCSSSRGAIRVIFYNDKGIIAGDTVTHPFENHQFTKSGTSEQTFSATTGFSSFGDQEAYRAHLVKPWTVRVYEGPDENATSSEYRLLFTAPVSTIVQ